MIKEVITGGSHLLKNLKAFFLIDLGQALLQVFHKSVFSESVQIGLREFTEDLLGI